MSEEFGAWMETVRGDTTVVVDETRPIPLWQHIMVGRRIFDLFDSRSHPAAGPKTVLVRPGSGSPRQATSGSRTRRELAAAMAADDAAATRVHNDFRPLPRPDVIAQARSVRTAPGDHFHLQAAPVVMRLLHQCLRSRLDLTSPEQVREIDTIIEKHTGELPRRGSRSSRISGLVQGITTADWHLTMPACCRPIRQTVEEHVRQGSRAGGLRDRDAGPRHQHAGTHGGARNVLVKYNGESHAELTPGEYTQLTGRAGRRGIDVEGHAVVLWQPGVEPTDVAGLASTTDVPAPQFVPAPLTTCRSISSNAWARRIHGSCSNVPSRSSKRIARWSAWVRGIERNEEALKGLQEKLGGADGEYFEYASFA